MSITVQYRRKKGERTGAIQVVLPDGQIIGRPTSSFYALDIDDKKASRIYFNKDDSDFMEDQKDLRALDMMKDGKVAGGADIHNQIYGIFFRGQREPKQYARLSALEKKFSANLKNFVRYYAWTKISKDSSLDPKLSRRLVFKEAGLDAQYFIKNPYFCGNIANEVIDPAKRSQISDRNGDIVFPKNNVTLNLATGFLDLFGFSGTSLSATRRLENGKVDYQYEIQIDGLPTIKRRNSEINGTRVDWFQGNKEKNDFIAYGRSASTDIKRGLLITKEMGDVLQVLIMFVWSLMYSQNSSYTMVTNDQVVYLLCMVLRVNCVVTFKTSQGSRMRNIAVFEPQAVEEEDQSLETEEEEEEDQSLDTEEDELVDKKAYKLARQNYRDEREKILQQNRRFIERLEAFASNPGKYKLHVKEKEDLLVEFPEEFYKSVIRDLKRLNYILAFDPNKRVGLGYKLSIQEIRNKITEIKENFLFNMFIRKNDDKFLITFAKKYSTSRSLWGKFIPDLPQYGERGFYRRVVPYVPREIPQPMQQEQPQIQQEQPQIQQEQQQGTSLLKEELPKFAQYPSIGSRVPIPIFPATTGERGTGFQFGGTKYDLSSEEENSFFSMLEFDNSPALFYDKETGETVDLIPILYDDIHSTLQRMQLDIYFYEFLNEILHNYYLLNEVLYSDSGLDNLIRKIIQYDIDLPQQTFNNPFQQTSQNPFYFPISQQSFAPPSFAPPSFAPQLSLTNRMLPPQIDYRQFDRERERPDFEMPSSKRAKVSGGKKTRNPLKKHSNKKGKTQKNKRSRKTIKKRNQKKKTKTRRHV